MFTLTPYAERARYSLLEQELFNALPQNGDTINTKDLVYARLKKGHWDVRYPRNIVATVMQKLIEKVELNKEPFVIKQAQQSGVRRKESIYWLEAKKERGSRVSAPVHSIFD